jgi:hypothetical protein
MAALGRPGENNDFSLVNPLSADLIGLDHLFYHLGVRNRSMVVLLANIGSLAALIWLTVTVARRRELSRAATAALAACVCPIVSYHRQYDLVLLALPFVYAAGRSFSEVGRTRTLYRAICLTVLAMLFHRTKTLRALMLVAARGGVKGRLIEMFALPMTTWLAIASIVLLMVAERSRLRGVAAMPIPAEGLRANPATAI